MGSYLAKKNIQGLSLSQGTIGLAAVMGAIFNGIMFLLSVQFFGYSVGMSMSAVSAIVANSISLYYLGALGSELAGPRI